MKRILFVDDEKNILDGVRRMLHTSRARWEMEFVTSGNDALQACRKKSFDVVVSDLRMPGMDGAELLGHVREEFPGTARLILSGYSEVELTARAVPVAYRVIAKPCAAKELAEAIERVCTLQDLMCTPALRQIIGTIGALPSLSDSYTALSRALRNPAASIAEIADIVERDIAMSAKVLQVVNSGFFGLPQRATSIHHAVSYLGMDTIKTLALYSEAFRLFTPDKRVPATFWPTMQRHAQRTAMIAGALPLVHEAHEVAIVAALLHDVGTLVLASAMPDEFCAVLAAMKQENCTQHEVEDRMFGISHAEIGAYLLGLWGINSIAVEAIAHHHHPTRITHSEMDCSLALYLANLLAHEMEIHPNDRNGEQLSDAARKELETLGLLGQYASFHGRAVEALSQ